MKANPSFATQKAAKRMDFFERKKMSAFRKKEWGWDTFHKFKDYANMESSLFPTLIRCRSSVFVITTSGHKWVNDSHSSYPKMKLSSFSRGWEIGVGKSNAERDLPSWIHSFKVWQKTRKRRRSELFIILGKLGAEEHELFWVWVVRKRAWVEHIWISPTGPLESPSH